MKVLKFGGTSVGTVASLINVKKIVESQPEDVIVVVSALGGITDRLINTARQASKGNITYLESLAEIVRRHNEIIEELVPSETRSEVTTIVNAMLEELSNIFRGVSLIRDLSDRTLDIIVSYGERLSSLIISHIIRDAQLFDSRSFIKTVDQFGRHILDADATGELIRTTFDNAKFKVAIVPGFIASAGDNRVTNLGRGGSDYTAAILAATLDANVLEIWTDVDGFMTADPRVINKTYVIDHLTFLEAMELCNFGAKVVYPPTIYPVYHKNIPIYIKNTFNPDAPGTLISNDNIGHDERLIKGISSINDTSLVNVSGLGMVGVTGINARIFSALARGGVSVFMVAQASSENNTSIAVKSDVSDMAVKVLNVEFASEIASGEINPITVQHDLATVAIVGENMKHSARIAGRLFNTLGRNGISIVACAQGSSEINISFIIEHCQLRKTLNVIHDTFFLSETQVLNLFVIGIGNVGRPLLRQIASQQENLLKDKSLRLHVVGVANSRKAVFNRDGIDIDNYLELLDSDQAIAITPEKIKDEVIRMNIYNPVFVDCTSSKEIAGLYADLLDHNVNVVAANKIAASSDYDNYLRLKSIARKKDVKFLFETNVGAGLPIINTINNLINSGDRILKIEAVLSGTLNYIFNTLSDDVTFSEAIKKAIEAGYSEPDPRVDLSGDDVVKKITILARESGYAIEKSDVHVDGLLPTKMLQGSVAGFLAEVQGLDREYETRRAEAQSNNCKYRFVATLENGNASVSLKAIDASHPFYHLEGSNNVILLTTERYHEYPMEIKGYGAGSEVTAAGVFADIISIANIR